MKLMQCKVVIANVMSAPSHQCESYTQLLFGTQVVFVENVDNVWMRIINEDGITFGWVLTAQFETVALESHYEKIIISGNDAAIWENNNKKIKLLHGTILPKTEINKIQFNTSVYFQMSTLIFSTENILPLLYFYLQSPYQWGGISTYGIDCSGLVKMFYRFFDVQLAHNAALQMNTGNKILSISNVSLGDLAFFENHQGIINHVGILLNSNQIIHASETNGSVSINDFDENGIIKNNENKSVPIYYSHKLKCINSILKISK